MKGIESIALSKAGGETVLASLLLSGVASPMSIISLTMFIVAIGVFRFWILSWDLALKRNQNIDCNGMQGEQRERARIFQMHSQTDRETEKFKPTFSYEFSEFCDSHSLFFPALHCLHVQRNYLWFDFHRISFSAFWCRCSEKRFRFLPSRCVCFDAAEIFSSSICSSCIKLVCETPSNRSIVISLAIVCAWRACNKPFSNAIESFASSSELLKLKLKLSFRLELLLFWFRCECR